ncbi:hypothetical protein AB0C04_28095 [Micromonospora sp. NPDC048909]|uniref:hypothetical protein n=1 Tax=Micromonospora sp. NPDC048909 TaxID=3155643 RepID=UPI0033E6D7CF
MPLPPATLVYLATRPWELGDVATWLSAIANIATVILATAAAIVGYRVYKVESGRDARAELDRRERAADDRRAQAALVSAWYGRSAEATDAFGGQWRTYAWGGWVLNASDSPIYDARITFLLADGEDHYEWPAATIRVIPPFRGEQFVKVDPEVRESISEEDWKHNLEVTLVFRDAAGRRWQRGHDGYLHEV